jgi:hypothetical protein
MDYDLEYPTHDQKQIFTSIHTCELLLWVQAHSHEPQLPIEAIIFQDILNIFLKNVLKVFQLFFLLLC